MLALAVTLMLGPFSVDTYLPAFPSIGAELGVDQQAVGLTISVYIFTLAFSQLVGGAFSDRFGRKKVLLGGLSIYAVASGLIALSGGMVGLLGGRMIQAVGAGWVLVSVPALVRDRVAGREAAKLFSMMGFIMLLAPGIAPSVGSALLAVGSWRSIFWSLALYGLLLIPVALFVVFKGAHARPQVASRMGMLKRYWEVVKVKPALPYIAWQSACFSLMMVYVTNSSTIYQGHFGQSEKMFSILFAANIVMMLCFNIMNRLLLSRMNSLRILQIATVFQAVGIVWLLLATFGGWSLYAFVPGMMLAIGSMGAISPNLQACYLEYYPESGGSAAALLGAMQFGVSGVASALSTGLPEGLGMLVLAMTACASVSFILLGVSLFWGRQQRNA